MAALGMNEWANKSQFVISYMNGIWVVIAILKLNIQTSSWTNKTNQIRSKTRIDLQIKSIHGCGFTNVHVICQQRLQVWLQTKTINEYFLLIIPISIRCFSASFQLIVHWINTMNIWNANVGHALFRK